VRGESVDTSLSLVKPNDWNPNEMTPFERESLKHGMLEDGWIASQALLVWGKDEKGKQRNVIMDGEHRWKIAAELGFKSGPMVFIDGLTEDEAKAFTVKMDARRGKFNQNLLGELLRSIAPTFEGGLTGLSIGVEDGLLAQLLANAPADLDGVAPGNKQTNPGVLGDGVTSTNANLRMVPIYFTPEKYEAFAAAVKVLSAKLKVETVSDVVEHCVLAASAKK